jgi:hypothetical protein
MFQLDDNFLNDLGLGAMPEEQKRAFLKHVYDELELSVGTKLSEGLNEMQLQEFEAFVDRNEEKVRAWFEKNMPDYAERPDFQQLHASAMQANAGLTESDPAWVSEVAILSEYGSLKWLEMNRPDYRQVVASELEKIRQEIIANREGILGSADQAA